MSTLMYSEESDGLSHDGAFHKGLHCLLRQKVLR